MIELTYLALFGIAMAAMFFGYGFGLFEGRSKGYKKRQKEEQKEKENQPPPQPEVITETVTKTVTVDDPGLLRLKNEGGSYTLDLDGARVDPLALPLEQRKRLIEILSVMRPWLEARPASPTPPAPIGATPSTPASAPASASSGIAPVPQASLLDRIQSKPTSSTPSIQTTPPAAEVRQSAPVQSTPPPSSQPVAPRTATIAKEDRPAAPANSMVSQIDAILQTHLIGTPLEERGIFLAQSHDGGVIVYIGLTRYNGVEEVPDPGIKAVIRAATKEWEQKYTPGLK